MRNHLLTFVTALALGHAGAAVRAQSPAAASPRPVFEAATVKPNKDGGPFNLLFQPGGRFRATNVTAKMLIGAAYGTPQPLPDFQISGGPKWLDTDRFDIVAKAAGDPQPQNNAPPAIMFQMLQSLLEDRFHLKVRRETSEVPVFVLQLARPDSKLGPRFRPTDTDCAALMRAALASGAGPPPPPAPGERPRCGARTFPGNISAGAMTLTQVVNGLSRLRDLNRQVVDRTGLTGAYDVDLVWTPDASLLPPAGDRPAGGPPLPPIDPNGPSIFTAIQEQWGLKLEPSRAPMNMLVIDAVERPTDD
jgi:uncharacterized protein (TIGR03435 family)